MDEYGNVLHSIKKGHLCCKFFHVLKKVVRSTIFCPVHVLVTKCQSLFNYIKLYQKVRKHLLRKEKNYKENQ